MTGRIQAEARLQSFEIVGKNMQISDKFKFIPSIVLFETPSLLWEAPFSLFHRSAFIATWGELERHRRRIQTVSRGDSDDSFISQRRIRTLVIIASILEKSFEYPSPNIRHTSARKQDELSCHPKKSNHEFPGKLCSFLVWFLSLIWLAVIFWILCFARLCIPHNGERKPE